MSEAEKAVRMTLVARRMTSNIGPQKYDDPANAEYAAWREKRKAGGHAKQ